MRLCSLGGRPFQFVRLDQQRKAVLQIALWHRRPWPGDRQPGRRFNLVQFCKEPRQCRPTVLRPFFEKLIIAVSPLEAALETRPSVNVDIGAIFHEMGNDDAVLHGRKDREPF